MPQNLAGARGRHPPSAQPSTNIQRTPSPRQPSDDEEEDSSYWPPVRHQPRKATHNWEASSHRSAPKSLDSDEDSPFASDLLNALLPRFNMLSLEQYDGTGDPYVNIQNYMITMKLRGANELFLCMTFHTTLRKSAKDWFNGLPPEYFLQVLSVVHSTRSLSPTSPSLQCLQSGVPEFKVPYHSHKEALVLWGSASTQFSSTWSFSMEHI